jgi:hypothetical protein
LTQNTATKIQFPAKMQTTIEVEGKTPKSCILITLGTMPAMISHYSFIPTFWPHYDDATVEAIIK